MERILLMMIGLGLLIVGVLISLPAIFNHPDRVDQLERFSRYLIQAPVWCLLSLLIIELALRGTVFNLPFYWNATNWAGDIPAPGSTILWGKEGYGITQYEKWGEIRTPYQDDKFENDVIVLGDSLTEAWHVVDEVKFSSHAETILRQDGYAADLHNLGRSGLAMADYVSWLPDYIALYQPRVIVVQLTRGDFTESFDVDQFNYFIAQDNKITDLFQRYDFSTGFKQRARREYHWDGFEIQQLGDERWRFMQRTGQTPANPDLNAGMQALLPELVGQQMEMLISACDGIPLVVVLLPSVPSISGNEIKTTDPAHEQLKMLIQNESAVTVVDPLPEFQQLASSGHLPRGFFNTTPGKGHLNQYGHEIVGQLLADAIEQILK